MVVLLASICCVLWGSAIPAIKTGYRLLEVIRLILRARLCLRESDLRWLDCLFCCLDQFVKRRSCCQKNP